MKREIAYLQEYELRAVVLRAAFASSSLIFLFLLFVGFSYHEVFNVPVIDEMMAYAEFFAFSYVSYSRRQ
jgi:hypothetical protein